MSIHYKTFFIDCSPKYHPEIAGEGIEFCWGVAKNTYRGKTISEKKRKENFLRLVAECTCNKSVIRIESVRKFGRRIRRYMLAYLGIERAKLKQSDGNLIHSCDFNLKVPEMSVQLVERLVKIHKSPHKCHRNIVDSELKFLKSVMAWMKKMNSGDDGAEGTADEIDD